MNPYWKLPISVNLRDTSCQVWWNTDKSHFLPILNRLWIIFCDFFCLRRNFEMGNSNSRRSVNLHEILEPKSLKNSILTSPEQINKLTVPKNKKTKKSEARKRQSKKRRSEKRKKTSMETALKAKIQLCSPKIDKTTLAHISWIFFSLHLDLKNKIYNYENIAISFKHFFWDASIRRLILLKDDFHLFGDLEINELNLSAWLLLDKKNRWSQVFKKKKSN